MFIAFLNRNKYTKFKLYYMFICSTILRKKMTFDLNIIKKYYDKLPNKIKELKLSLNVCSITFPFNISSKATTVSIIVLFHFHF